MLLSPPLVAPTGSPARPPPRASVCDHLQAPLLASPPCPRTAWLLQIASVVVLDDDDGYLHDDGLNSPCCPAGRLSTEALLVSQTVR